MDRVEVFHGSVWRRGWVRVLLTGQCYKVCFVATEEEHVFRHSHVRRLKVWEDGAWHDGPPKVATPSRGMKPKTMSSRKGHKACDSIPES
ncbi:unnamed protein product [Brassica oleracea]|uniref:Agenet domain-containing protein n=1 Tax=Brassica cretica TaxID=69181 RepID=A0ABQ7DJU0_BRACR|nr:hypothetical protein DY000_02028302 [Brassica cretica]